MSRQGAEEKIRQKITDWETAAGNDDTRGNPLWQRLAQDLPSPVRSKHKVLRYCAMAASVLLLVTVGLYLWLQPGGQPQQAVIGRPVAAPTPPSVAAIPVPAPTPTPIPTQRKALPKTPSHKPQRTPAHSTLAYENTEPNSGDYDQQSTYGLFAGLTEATENSGADIPPTSNADFMSITY